MGRGAVATGDRRADQHRVGLLGPTVDRQRPAGHRLGPGGIAAAQQQPSSLPVKGVNPKDKARAIAAAERSASAYTTLRKAAAAANRVGESIKIARLVETGEDPANARFFSEEAAGQPHFDLPRYVVHRLLAAGVEQVEALHLDTYADPDRFYSYRRATHLGEADYGRQLSAIALP